MVIFESFLAERFGKKIIRDGVKVNSFTRTVESDSKVQLLTTKELHIYIPKRFEDAGMAKIEDSFRTINFGAWVIDGCYGVVDVPSFIDFLPSSLQTVMIGEDEYYELFFDANSLVIDNCRCFKDSDAAYMTYNEFVAKPNMCAFMSYDDALLCLHKLAKCAGLKLERTNVATEAIIASTARDAANLNNSYRHARLTNNKVVPKYIGIRNIQYGVSNLATALMGAYSDVGIDSLLVTPAKKAEKYETLLRI